MGQFKSLNKHLASLKGQFDREGQCGKQFLKM